MNTHECRQIARTIQRMHAHGPESELEDDSLVELAKCIDFLAARCEYLEEQLYQHTNTEGAHQA